MHARDKYDKLELIVCCNDDIWLSRNILSNCFDVYKESGLDFYQPCYDDCNFMDLFAKTIVPAEQYEPVNYEYTVNYIDGTFMCIPIKTLDKIGLYYMKI